MRFGSRFSSDAEEASKGEDWDKEVVRLPDDGCQLPVGADSLRASDIPLRNEQAWADSGPTAFSHWLLQWIVRL